MYIYDSKAKALVGIITITGTYPISVVDYYRWHHMYLDIDNIDMNHKCYAGDYINLERIVPSKVNKPKDKRVWFKV